MIFWGLILPLIKTLISAIPQYETYLSFRLDLGFGLYCYSLDLDIQWSQQGYG